MNQIFTNTTTIQPPNNTIKHASYTLAALEPVILSEEQQWQIDEENRIAEEKRGHKYIAPIASQSISVDPVPTQYQPADISINESAVDDQPTTEQRNISVTADTTTVTRNDVTVNRPVTDNTTVTTNDTVKVPSSETTKTNITSSNNNIAKIFSQIKNDITVSKDISNKKAEIKEQETKSVEATTSPLQKAKKQAEEKIIEQNSLKVNW